MGKKLLITIPTIVCSMLIAVDAIAKDPKSVSNWVQKLSSKREKITNFHYYFHDIQSGKNPTAVPVAKANSTASSPTLFGQVMVIDDPLTAGPEPHSEIVGRAQGIYGFSTVRGDIGLLMTMNIVFTSGKYNGSTLSLLGRNPVLDEYREMAIVGGSGVFRLARGIATAKTYSVHQYGDAVVEYHVIVIHY